MENIHYQVYVKKYGIDSAKIVKKNSNVLSYGDYNDIDNTLNYLINTLNISTSEIEKCPSILYRNVNAIKSNIEFLKNKKINVYKIDSCLYILLTKPEVLKDTFNYVVNNYGIDAVHKNKSILSVEKDMSFIDEIDKKILKENFSEDLIKQIDIDNAIKIFNYLKDNDVFYAKDLFLNSFDLFLLPCEIFIKKFEYLKKVLGNDFVDKLGEDKSLIEIMYEYNV